MSRPAPSYKGLTRIASLVSLCVALVLVCVKVWAWAATGSIALLTSAADGLVDVLASMVTLIGVRYALRPADKGHRYGHGKAEAVAAFVQALLLGAAGLVLGGESIGRIINPQPLAQLGAVGQAPAQHGQRPTALLGLLIGRAGATGDVAGVPVLDGGGVVEGHPVLEGDQRVVGVVERPVAHRSAASA